MSRQLIRNRSAFGARPQDMPVFGTSAATFNDNGVTALYQHLAGLLAARGLPPAAGRTSTNAASVIPPARTGYLAEIAGTVRGYHEETARQAQAVRRTQRLAAVRAELSEDILAERSVASLLDQAQRDVRADSAELIAGWPAIGRIQDESMLYEQRKHDGTLPLIGVNTFRNPAGTVAAPAELARATEEERKSQLERVRDFTERHRDQAHAALAELKEATRSGGNVFAVLMDAARVCSLQQITEAFFEVGGQYRRNV